MMMMTMIVIISEILVVVVFCSLWTVCQELFLHILYNSNNNEDYYVYNVYKVVCSPPVKSKITNR